MLLNNTLPKQSVILPLMKPLYRGGEARRNPDEANYSKLIRDEAMQVAGQVLLAGSIKLEITIYDTQFDEDPLLVCKLVMDALSGVCYQDDKYVDEVIVEQKFLSPHPYKRRRALPYIEIRCSNLPVITVFGCARGKKYPLYGANELQRIKIEHEKVRHDVNDSLKAQSLVPVNYGQVAVEAEIKHGSPWTMGDLDNVMMCYWECLKRHMTLTNNSITSLHIRRLYVPGINQDEVELSMYY